jgi:hypothetical protein
VCGYSVAQALKQGLLAGADVLGHRLRATASPARPERGGRDGERCIRDVVGSRRILGGEDGEEVIAAARPARPAPAPERGRARCFNRGRRR